MLETNTKFYRRDLWLDRAMASWEVQWYCFGQDVGEFSDSGKFTD